MLIPKWDNSGRWTGGFTSSVDYWDRKSRHIEDSIAAMHEREKMYYDKKGTVETAEKRQRDALREIAERTRARIRRVQGTNPKMCDCGWCKELEKLALLAEAGLEPAMELCVSCVWCGDTETVKSLRSDEYRTVLCANCYASWQKEANRRCAMNEDQLCVLVRDWHEWYVSSKYFASPPTPTMDLIAMCHDLGYGLAFRDVRVIHSFIASSYYGVWLRRDEVSNKAGNKCPHGYNHWANCPDCKDLGHPMPEQLKQAYSVCRYLRKENERLEKENNRLRTRNYVLRVMQQSHETREELLKDKAEKETKEVMDKIIGLETTEVMRRMRPILAEFWADYWDKVWNGDPDAKDPFPGLGSLPFSG